MKGLKIAVVVHGRFHAFDLVKALLAQGHVVRLFTNYPKIIVKRFGIDVQHVQSFVLHGVLARLATRLPRKVQQSGESWLHRAFGTWAARQLRKSEWDVAFIWSGVAEESLKTCRAQCKLLGLMRGSAHIRAQARLLAEEEARTGQPQEQPSHWMLAREGREYELADVIFPISSFSYQTFVAAGITETKLSLLCAGADLNHFRVTPQVAEERCQRILTNQRLRVLNVGTFCYRKGVADLAEAMAVAGQEHYEYRHVGPVAAEADELADNLQGLVRFEGKKDHYALREFYAWGDIFVLPSIEDGFQTVLSQASASGLPIITTPNGAGLDLVREGKTGFVLPIRRPDLLVEKLRWCHENRLALAEMARRSYDDFQPRSWEAVAQEFTDICARRLAARAETRGA
jgi:glycosyltransferase involved in cell wall biosynthesis